MYLLSICMCICICMHMHVCMLNLLSGPTNTASLPRAANRGATSVQLSAYVSRAPPCVMTRGVRAPRGSSREKRHPKKPKQGNALYGLQIHISGAGLCPACRRVTTHANPWSGVQVVHEHTTFTSHRCVHVVTECLQTNRLTLDVMIQERCASVLLFACVHTLI